MNKILNTLLSLLMLATICACKNNSTSTKTDNQNTAMIESKIKSLNNQLIVAAKKRDFKQVDYIYADDALLLPELHTIIDGKEDISTFYNRIFERQKLVAYQKTSNEILDLGSQILEIGTFTKTFEKLEKQEGKYWNVWTPLANGELKLQSESFGYFHKVEDYDSHAIETFQKRPTVTQSRNNKKIPAELQAYDAYTEEIVRERDVEKAMDLYENDAAYFAVAEKGIFGLNDLTEYYRNYYSHPVTIDSISIWTYDYKKVKHGFLKYMKFHVEWTVPELSGKTSGTNIVYWRRQPDGSLKRRRLIGLHLYQ